MSLVVPRALFGIMIAYSLAFSAAAEKPSSSTAKGGQDEMICEKQEVLGSRLAMKRVCMTRAQWTQKKRDERDLVHRTQVGPCMRKAGCQ